MKGPMTRVYEKLYGLTIPLSVFRTEGAALAYIRKLQLMHPDKVYTYSEKWE